MDIHTDAILQPIYFVHHPDCCLRRQPATAQQQKFIIVDNKATIHPVATQ